MRLCIFLTALIIALFSCKPQPDQVRESYVPVRIHTTDSLRTLSGLAWTVQTNGAIRAGVALGNSRVFFGSADGNLYAVNKESGHVDWRFSTHGAITSVPCLANNVLYVTSRDNHLYAIDASTGALQWKLAMGKPLPHEWGWEYFQSSAVYDGNTVYVGSADGLLYAVDAADGKTRWTFKTNGRIRSTPVIHQNELFIASFDGVLYVLNKTTGKLQWTYETEGAHIKSEESGWDRNSLDATPYITGGLAVFGSRDGNVYCLDIAKRALKWKFTYGPTWSLSSPLVHEGKVYVGWSDNNIFSALDIDSGKEVWKYVAGDYVYASPIIAGDNVIVASADHRLYAFERHTGRVQWTFNTNGSIYASPVCDGNTLYIGSDDGKLYALNGSTKAPAPHIALFATDTGHPYLKGNPKITTYFQKRGVPLLDSAALRRFMQERIGDKAPGIIIFNHSTIPPNLLSPQPQSGIFRRYLEAGGMVVWTSFAPNLVSFDANGNYLGENPTVANALLDMQHDLVHDGGEYSCAATPAGTAVGLPSFFVGTFSVPATSVTNVLATNEYGRAVCWTRQIGAGKFVQLRTWSNDVSEEALGAMENTMKFLRQQ